VRTSASSVLTFHEMIKSYYSVFLPIVSTTRPSCRDRISSKDSNHRSAQVKKVFTSSGLLRIGPDDQLYDANGG
jgi:hypothetical protein